uniref:Uncharacterized protein n=1 Tax=Eutreptiella gymnastica TaxID=73025 RepID=A0A7S1I498_9EUGL
MSDSLLVSGLPMASPRQSQRPWWEIVSLIMHEAIQEGSSLFNDKRYKAALKVYKDALKRTMSHANGEVLRRLQQGRRDAKRSKIHIFAGFELANASHQAWEIRKSFDECQWMLMPGRGIVPAHDGTADSIVSAGTLRGPVAGLVLSTEGEAGVTVRRAPTEWAKRKISQAIEDADQLSSKGQVTECVRTYEQCCRKIANEAGDPGEQMVRDILGCNDAIITERSWSLRSLLHYLLLCRTAQSSEELATPRSSGPLSPASSTPGYLSSPNLSPPDLSPLAPATRNEG